MRSIPRSVSCREPDKAQLEQAMKGHVLDTVQLIGTYQKQGK